MTNAKPGCQPCESPAWWRRRRGTSLSPVELSRRRGYLGQDLVSF